jgi:curved DNA-binding protein CbpA
VAEDPEEALRRARRAVAKATHPDRGGDPQTHRAAMEALSRLEGPSPLDQVRGRVTGRLRELGRLPGRVRQAYQEGRGETEVDGPDPS